ncbi:hypothetical protein [Accumulibacter sp.]|uniref:hypothetical protein n=1 Tax=Accumulibacter sp. TaxID=2053492 RepID=UPI0025DFF1AC|nr:hypothetical protein [Accumulibacter sp.]MCM8639356.1 hypothetical protein [Accumulibacter sp.]
MDLSDDPHIDLLQDIETGLKAEYERHPTLTDTLCIFALENAKVAVKQAFGFARNEKSARTAVTGGIVDWCVEVARKRVDKVDGLTLREFNARVDKIIRSVRRHSHDGPRAYYEFIRNYV